MRVGTKICASSFAALMLTGCLERSISGSYMSRQPSAAELLQLTQTPDHHLIGTIQRATLNSDGRIVTSTGSVIGVVDGENFTVTVFNTIIPSGDNFGGTVTSTGLDLIIPAKSGSSSAQAETAHFNLSTLNDYNAAVSKLTEAGSVILAKKQRDQQIDTLDREAALLTQVLNEFVASAHRMIEQQLHVVEFYAKAVPQQQERLDLARRLAAGNSLQQGQAQMIVSQMNVAKATITNTGVGIDRTIKENADRETSLNTGIQRFTKICLGDGMVSPGDIIPDMGPCKSLTSAVATYRAVLGPLHSSLNTVIQAKAKGLQQLSDIWHAASTVH